VRAEVEHDENGVPSGVAGVEYSSRARTGAEERAMGALMALINLSHHQVAVSNELVSLLAVSAAMDHLTSPSYEIRKAATLLLAGLTAANERSAEEIVSFVHPDGAVDGIEMLLCNLSDDDAEDDLSQHSFLVLSNMKHTAANRYAPCSILRLYNVSWRAGFTGRLAWLFYADTGWVAYRGRMCGSVERYLSALPSAEPTSLRPGGGLLGSSKLLDDLGHVEICTRLDKYFAVLNGAFAQRMSFSACTFSSAQAVATLQGSCTPSQQFDNLSVRHTVWHGCFPCCFVMSHRCRPCWAMAATCSRISSM